MVIQVKCIQKFRDKNGIITGYRLIDTQGNTKDVTPKALKYVIRLGKLEVTNLTLTSDNRLVDRHDITQIKSNTQIVKEFIAKQRLLGVEIKWKFSDDYETVIRYIGYDKKVAIPPVKYIGAEAFSFSSVESITLPASIINIGNKAFHNCTHLQSIKIPYAVKEISDSTFDWCSGLTSIILPGRLARIGNFAFYYCKELQSIEIPDSVISIGNFAFCYCKNLQSIVIPSSVTEIGDAAFYCCENLQSIVIPSSVTRIGDSAFVECSSLQSVILPDTITKIGDSAFSKCNNLKSITIPASVNKIGMYAFSVDQSKASNCTITIQNRDFLQGEGWAEGRQVIIE